MDGLWWRDAHNSKLKVQGLFCIYLEKWGSFCESWLASRTKIALKPSRNPRSKRTIFSSLPSFKGIKQAKIKHIIRDPYFTGWFFTIHINRLSWDERWLRAWWSWDAVQRGWSWDKRERGYRDEGLCWVALQERSWHLS